MQTHNVALAGPIADFIVSVSPDGVVTGSDKDLKGLIADSPTLQADYAHDEDAIVKDSETVDHAFEGPVADGSQDKKDASTGKLIFKEEVKEGDVGWQSIRVLVKALGGDHVALFFVMWLGASVAEFSLSSAKLWFMGFWSSQYEKYPIEQIPVLW